jgi:hypothetical protein
VNGVDPVRVEEDSLGQGGLSSVDVSADSYVSDFLKLRDHGTTIGVKGKDQV